jgi:type I restriction-modification system DNA methylase subunit
MARSDNKPRATEVDAYIFIKSTLRDLGWDVRNPQRCATGQVYTQNECLEHPHIKERLGSDRPENVVKISETEFWVIEAKKDQRELTRALQEAEDYARSINRSKVIRAVLVSGVAGNESSGYLCQTRVSKGNRFHAVTFNGKDASSLLSPDVVKRVMTEGPAIADVPIDEQRFLSKAEKINEHLHLGAINKNYRARVMAALLLSLIEDTPPDVNAAPSALIRDINARAERVLKMQGKKEFLQYIEIALPPTEDNHVKFKNALVKTIQELNLLNIRSAMNSGTDVLGKFYEVFLKYGNGAKEIGIVLTPRHITKFAVEAMGVTHQDVVYDPTCGTGGFLVAAFDYVKQSSNQTQLERFKENNLYGVEQEAEVVALAIVNMIFRGDGKTNIVEGNCFQKNIVKTEEQQRPKYSVKSPQEKELAVTKVLMNPPFALKTSDEKEFKFIEQALKQMQDGGLLFSVLPYPAMVKPGQYRHWREHSLLKKNTLLSVVTFPPDLFYPIGVHSVGIFVRKGIPHPKQQNVLWLRALNDGLLKRKGKRLPNTRAANDYDAARDNVKAFLLNPRHSLPNVNRFQKASPISFEDPLLELVPENYLDEAPPTEREIEVGIERVIRDTISFFVSEGWRH